ncbi:divalent-cation tolerance protein CutA [filamentous cyanobacterium LEGE 11480]|uniref:Divalent-cation tolerance protein CutA n=1 Tax=Romeriopsis navalis LEGE 11480 TaxID=2777977 RepID=A0A928VH61_9CYAN|nr:divalent-cation tolerance protein CutA [Romeriopsis navalis]MBE9028528.1 divalent-cation tolerance protein CutA [Romeriopsis navalis LEGE 11480]
MAQPPSTEFCLVLVTTPNETCAKSIARTLLTEQLAACINCLAVDSFYQWEDKLNHDHEFQLIIKTQSQLFDELAARLTVMHPYEVPEIIAIPVTAGAPPYLNWLRQNTRSSLAATPSAPAMQG